MAHSSELLAPTLSQEATAVIAALQENALTPNPNERVCREIGSRSIELFVAPMAAGKTTLIQYIAAHYPDFAEVQGIATRPRRPNERPGEIGAFLPHNEDTIFELKQLFDARELIQYIVHPTTGHIYASTIEDYGPKFNLLPVLSSGIAQFENLAFKRVSPASIICTTEEWDYRSKLRLPYMRPDDVHKRNQEAQMSLSWSLERKDVSWIHNAHGQLDIAARRAVAIAKQEYDDIGPRHLGEKLLKHIGKVASGHY